MNKIFFMIPAIGLLLSACAPEIRYRDKIKVFMPDSRFFECSKTPIQYDADSLQDGQVASTLIDWSQDLDQCVGNMGAIEDSLREAKGRFE